MRMKKMEVDMESESWHDDSELEETLPTSGFANNGSCYRSRPQLARYYCSLEKITTIKEKLHKNNLKEFQRSCFGHLLKMNPLCFQGPLLLHLLLKIDTAASESTNTLVFNINNSVIEFKPIDFQFITGLRWGTSQAAAAAATATSSRIHEDVFKGSQAVLFKHVEEAFLDVCHKHKGGREVTLKLALLYFLYGVVLPVSPSKKIELRYLHLADDLRVFRAFPWGRVGYELLVSSMLSARRSLDGPRVLTKLSVPGFTFALQVWAYEIMPDLATYCAARVLNYDSNRILNWSAKRMIHFDNLTEFFTLGDGDEALSAKEQQNVKVEDEEAMEEATPARHSRLSPNPISTNKLQSSSVEIERNRAIVALAFDDSPAQHTPQPLWKEMTSDTSKSYIFGTEAEYERAKGLYEAHLDHTKSLKLWVGYAHFEAFARIRGSETHNKRKCRESGRAVFERGLSYFESCAPKLKEERRMLLEARLEMEYSFGEVGDVGSVRAKLPHKVKNRTSRYEDAQVLKKHKTIIID